MPGVSAPAGADPGSGGRAGVPRPHRPTRRSARAPGSPPPCTGRRSRSGAPARSPTRSTAARAAVDALAPLAPALAASLQRHLGAIDALGLDAPGPLGVAHGDFDPSQVLFDGPTTSLVDFDTVCLAEPALDLGQFTGHLAAAVRRSRRPRGRAPRRRRGPRGPRSSVSTCDASPRSDPDALLARVAAYRTVTLARLAVRSWCQLKPQRLRPVLALLDEPPRIRIGVP